MAKKILVAIEELDLHLQGSLGQIHVKQLCSRSKGVHLLCLEFRQAKMSRKQQPQQSMIHRKQQQHCRQPPTGEYTGGDTKSLEASYMGGVDTAPGKEEEEEQQPQQHQATKGSSASENDWQRVKSRHRPQRHSPAAECTAVGTGAAVAAVSEKKKKKKTRSAKYNENNIRRLLEFNQHKKAAFEEAERIRTSVKTLARSAGEAAKTSTAVKTSAAASPAVTRARAAAQTPMRGTEQLKEIERLVESVFSPQNPAMQRLQAEWDKKLSTTQEVESIGCCYSRKL